MYIYNIIEYYIRFKQTIWYFNRNFTSKSYFLKTFNSEFQEIKIWFTDQNNNPLEVEDKINITLIIK